jgi:branched-chain amino acid transport system permease protein
MRVVNFTHGELYAFGAYAMYALVMKFGVNFFAALALATALGVILDCCVRLQERSASTART